MNYALRPQKIDFDSVWADLKLSVIDVIQLHPIAKKVWDHKFSDVYNICVAIPDPEVNSDHTERLYSCLVACVEEHVRSQYETIMKVPRDQLLQNYERMWKTFYNGTAYVHKLFGYLNKQYVLTKKSLEPDLVAQYAPYLVKTDVKEVGCMALDIWRSRLVRPIISQLVDLLLEAIAQDRLGNVPTYRDTVEAVIMSFVQMEQYDFGIDPLSRPNSGKVETVKEFYQKEFEEPFLKSTELYYSSLAQKMLSELSCSQYMEQVLHILEAEKIRAAAYVHKSSVDKVVKLCQNVMINEHKDKLNGVCCDLIKNEERQDLHNMYKLLKPLDFGLAVMVKEFEEHVKRKGQEAIMNLSGENVPQQFVENVLQVYDRYSDMKMQVFLDDGDFAGALDKALQSVVNTRLDKTTSKASERLARYADNLLRKSTKGLSDAELEERLTRAIVIFRYIEDKDVFQKFYSKMLSSRLIHSTSLSMDAEETMINKLKQACGYEFTSKLSRMYTDIGLCPDLRTEFEKYLSDNNVNDPTNMQPLILTAGSWPLSAPTVGGSGTPPSHVESVSFVVPPPMKVATDEFQKYYLTKHSGRRLSWLFHSSHGELKTTFLDKPYVIQMSVFQMAVLICFNHRLSYKISELSENVGLTGDLIFKIVRSLIDGSMVICEDRELTDDTDVVLNTGMVSKRVRFKLPMVQSTKQIEKEAETVNNTIAQDRKYYIECAVVRIMKTRKVLKHQQLITEVMDQIKGRFKPDLTLVKKCIEDLIDKLYMQRTNKNDEYQYLA